MEENKDAPEESQRGQRYWQVLVLLLVVIVTVGSILGRDRVNEFALYGYSGVFAVSLLGNATILFPAPSLAVVFGMGSALNPVLVGLVAGIGEALGELTGYAAGYGGQPFLQDYKRYSQFEYWMRRRGLLTVFALSMVPNPFFDVAGIIAGMTRLSLWKFLLVCWLGKTIKTSAFALTGAHSVLLFEHFMQWISSWRVPPLTRYLNFCLGEIAYA